MYKKGDVVVAVKWWNTVGHRIEVGKKYVVEKTYTTISPNPQARSFTQIGVKGPYLKNKDIIVYFPAHFFNHLDADINDCM